MRYGTPGYNEEFWLTILFQAQLLRPMVSIPHHDPADAKVALVTGAARRVGAVIVRTLHGAGLRVLLHYRSSERDAGMLADELNAERPGSVVTLKADLMDLEGLPGLVARGVQAFGRLDVLVNNASTFYPTPLGGITPAQWEDLMGSNLKAPLFLSQAAAPYLRQTRGCIVNILDINAERPKSGHPVYCAAKAGLAMLTRSLALDLGPEVRCNGVAPGAILWPEQELSEAEKRDALSRTPLQRRGEPTDVAGAVLFLVRDAGYVTGQVLAVDGGRSVVA